MILIVDDENAVRLSISLALSRAGYACECASTEAEAMDHVRDEALQLVVLDMNLTLTTTGQQGLEMLRKIKILRPEVPVIMLTAWGTIPLAVQSMSLGAEDFLTKPWSNADLLAKVRKFLSRHEAEAVEESAPTLDEIERDAVIKALRACDGNLSNTARRLGITRQALYRRMEKYGL